MLNGLIIIFFLRTIEEVKCAFVIWGLRIVIIRLYRYIFDILDRSADCPFPCVINGHNFCRPPPCPVPACRDPISIPGQCCGTCPEDCPKGTCKVGNKTTCYPVPCPLPPCVNPVTTPGDCCPHCPEGTYTVYINT